MDWVSRFNSYRNRIRITNRIDTSRSRLFLAANSSYALREIEPELEEKVNSILDTHIYPSISNLTNIEDRYYEKD